MRCLLGALLLSSSVAWADAISFGSGSCGKLDGGVALPCSGSNYIAFTRMACSMKRNFVHPLVRDTIVDAFVALQPRVPARTWQYGEMGHEHGGPLSPHRTHQNGLAADFLMPMLNARGEPEQLPISASNKYGYGLELDAEGRIDSLTVDWQAVGDHLLALEAAGRAHDVTIERIIVTPSFHAHLFAAVPKLKHLQALFMKKDAWVRHDEHYHVDFAIPARLHRPLTCR